MKDVIINWDKDIFDGEKRLLPNAKILYTQIHLSDKNESWSLVFEFDETSRIQGYRSKAKVHFLAEDAPREMLKNGFKFDFLDGQKKIGECEIIEKRSLNIEDILSKVDLIENTKKEFRNYINSVHPGDFSYTEDQLEKLTKYFFDYPFLFPIVLNLNQDIAKRFLEKYYFGEHIESNPIYYSHLPFFLYNLKKAIGENSLIKYFNRIPKRVREHQILKSILDEIM